MNREKDMNTKARRVLVVEDETDIAHLVALHLRDANCEVTLASDGHEDAGQVVVYLML